MEHLPEKDEVSEAQVDKPLSSFQCAALDALMEGKSIAEAAEAAGVSYRTVERWRDEHPRFKADYNRWLRQKAATIQGRLMGVADESAELMVEAVRKKKHLPTAKAIVRELGLLKPLGNAPTTPAGVASEMELDRREQELQIQERADVLDEQELTQFIRRIERRQKQKFLEKQKTVLDGPPDAA